MGLFDIFKTDKKNFGTLHCFDTREWNTGHSVDIKGLTNFIKDYDDKIKQLILVVKNNKPLPNLSVKKATEELETSYNDMSNAIHDGMFKTEKRKKFPINRYDSYVSWSDG